MDSQTIAPDTLTARADHSRFVQRSRRRYAPDLASLPAGLPTSEIIGELIEALRAAGRPLPQAMRVARQLVLERLAVLDVEHAAPMQDITCAMTQLAETTLDLALAQAQSEHDVRYGAPLNAAGQRIDFWVVGNHHFGCG